MLYLKRNNTERVDDTVSTQSKWRNGNANFINQNSLHERHKYKIPNMSNLHLKCVSLAILHFN